MLLRRILSAWVLISFIGTSITPKIAQAQGVAGLPLPGVMVNLSPAYQPVIIRGLTVHKDNPFLFDFIVDIGQDRMSGEPLKKEGEKLIKYFLASLAIPDHDVWVNLSPYEKDRIIPQVLGQTEMGRDLLEQDYILKQITASLIYPEKQLGRDFWNRVYAKAQAEYGSTQVPVNTFNKVWIMADKAEVFEHNQTAFVVGQHLKVMLEEDYLALAKHVSLRGAEGDAAISSTLPSERALNVKAPQGNNLTHSITSQIIKQIILPELEKEVNTGKNFANLRQIFNSIILASWYKKNLKQALLNQFYANKSNVNGVIASGAKQSQEQIYDQYLQAYKKGVFNYIKDDVANGQSVPRKYFSGGILGEGAASPDRLTDITDVGMGAEKLKDIHDPLVDFAAVASSNEDAVRMDDKLGFIKRALGMASFADWDVGIKVILTKDSILRMTENQSPIVISPSHATYKIMDVENHGLREAWNDLLNFGDNTHGAYFVVKDNRGYFYVDMGNGVSAIFDADLDQMVYTNIEDMISIDKLMPQAIQNRVLLFKNNNPTRHDGLFRILRINTDQKRIETQGILTLLPKPLNLDYTVFDEGEFVATGLNNRQLENQGRIATILKREGFIKNVTEVGPFTNINDLKVDPHHIADILSKVLGELNLDQDVPFDEVSSMKLIYQMLLFLDRALVSSPSKSKEKLSIALSMGETIRFKERKGKKIVLSLEFGTQDTRGDHTNLSFPSPVDQKKITVDIEQIHEGRRSSFVHPTLSKDDGGRGFDAFGAPVSLRIDPDTNDVLVTANTTVIDIHSNQGFTQDKAMEGSREIVFTLARHSFFASSILDMIREMERNINIENPTPLAKMPGYIVLLPDWLNKTGSIAGRERMEIFNELYHEKDFPHLYVSNHIEDAVINLEGKQQLIEWLEKTKSALYIQMMFHTSKGYFNGEYSDQIHQILLDSSKKEFRVEDAKSYHLKREEVAFIADESGSGPHYAVIMDKQEFYRFANLLPSNLLEDLEQGILGTTMKKDDAAYDEALSTSKSSVMTAALLAVGETIRFKSQAKNIVVHLVQGSSLNHFVQVSINSAQNHLTLTHVLSADNKFATYEKIPFSIDTAMSAKRDEVALGIGAMTEKPGSIFRRPQPLPSKVGLEAAAGDFSQTVEMYPTPTPDIQGRLYHGAPAFQRIDGALAANGGIDLNANAMQWKIAKDGHGVEMNVDSAMVAQIKRQGIHWLSPIVLSITPVNNVWSLMNIQAPSLD